MDVVALGFLAGVAVLQQFSTLPNLWFPLSLVLLVFLIVFLLVLCLLFAERFNTRFYSCFFIKSVKKWRLLLVFLLSASAGFCWATIAGYLLLADGLDPALEGQDVVVEGVIASLPETQNRRVRFEFEPDSILKNGKAQALPGKLLLSWYHRSNKKAPELNVGERWRLQVRLKRPHGFMNPGGFDYEAFLFRKEIRAKGYVRKAAGVNQRLAEASVYYPVEQVRQNLREKLNRTLGDHELKGIVMALAIGDRQKITRPQWEVLTRTGTSHLVAISGLHVGLVAGFAFFAVRRLWRLSARVVLVWPAAKAGAMAGLLAATVYAMLAGFSVPTQRALVMVAVVMLAVILQRRTRPSSLLSLALLLVLMIDPMAVLAPGFWLSFAAVAIILYGMAGRLGGDIGWRKWWWRWGRVQWLVTVGLFPVLILLFQKASVVSPLANLFAVPWVSLVTVPLTLLGTVFLSLMPLVGESLLELALWSIDILWWMLQLFSDWFFAQWLQAVPSTWALVCAMLGLIWLLAPRGIPNRWLGVVWLLPMVFSGSTAIPEGEARFALLDVGQGLAAVVETRNHVLVFDTGPRYSSGFNTGGAVIAPYLRAKGVGRIDMLVVSHGDNDHIGGAADLAAQLPVDSIISSVPEKLHPLEAVNCIAGEHWLWDGVQFEVLSPDQSSTHKKGHGGNNRGNNRSCVLRVQAGSDSVLLTGDIERGAERDLLYRVAAKLPSNILVVPHHGSKTSSTAAFIDAVSPRVALFPVGYRNRYGFPKETVVKRYEDKKAQLFDSASHGAVEMRLGGEIGAEHTIQTWRQKSARYWHYQ
jgi:competence protein ComEC